MRWQYQQNRERGFEIAAPVPSPKVSKIAQHTPKVGSVISKASSTKWSSCATTGPKVIAFTERSLNTVA
jgi:hypothetical protein